MNFTGGGDWNSSDQTHATIVLVNCALNAPLILLSIAGNVLVLVALSKTSYVDSTSIIMLASLAFSDLLVGLLAQPLFIADELKSLTTQDPIRLFVIISRKFTFSITLYETQNLKAKCTSRDWSKVHWTRLYFTFVWSSVIFHILFYW